MGCDTAHKLCQAAHGGLLDSNVHVYVYVYRVLMSAMASVGLLTAWVGILRMDGSQFKRLVRVLGVDGG